MEWLIKISAVAVVTAVLCVVVRENSKEMALLLSLAACVSALLLVAGLLSPVLSVLEQLRELSGLNRSVTAPLLKVTGIGLLTQIAGSVCSDAGEKALEKTVEITGSVLSVYTALPLLTAVLDLLEDMLGG